jgi:hypothetical protein
MSASVHVPGPIGGSPTSVAAFGVADLRVHAPSTRRATQGSPGALVAIALVLRLAAGATATAQTVPGRNGTMDANGNGTAATAGTSTGTTQAKAVGGYGGNGGKGNSVQKGTGGQGGTGGAAGAATATATNLTGGANAEAYGGGPEPSSALLLLIGTMTAIGLAWARRAPREASAFR